MYLPNFPKCGKIFPINSIGLAEGIAFKPQIAANRMGIPFIGASSGNFARSRQLLKQYLDFLGCDKTTEIVWFVDAGAITNLSVMGVYRRSIDLLRSWGYKLKIAWWNQIHSAIRWLEISLNSYRV